MAITVEVKTRLALLVARSLFALRWIVGGERAQRWAWGAAHRFSRWRVLGGKWQRFQP